MCDPVSIGIGLVGGAVASKALAPKAPRAAPAADPEAERMKAEADAAAAANRKLAADKARRREQGSLIARGAPSLGDEQNTGDGVINSMGNPLNAGSGAVFRGAVNKRVGASSSLLSRGAGVAASGGRKVDRYAAEVPY